LATVLTAFGSGPFADNTPFVNAALLDVLFAVLAVSGLTLGAVIGERERAETARDQQKRAENALSSVNRKLIAAQEQERTRIGRELHDDIGQRLAMLSVKLAGFAINSGESETDRAQAIELQKMASGIAQDVQMLSHELHSAKVAILGAAASMRSFCNEFAGQQGIEIAFDSDELPELSSDISLCLYRVLQEALHNAAKHSGAGRIDVELTDNNALLRMKITDGGKGFDPVRASKGLGLASMRERVRMIGGELAIVSAPGRGTTLVAQVRSVASTVPTAAVSSSR